MVYRRRYLSGQSATTVQIAEKAVTSDKIGDKAVDTPQLADDAVTSEKIADGEVKTEDIGDQAVQTQDIKNSAVTGPKIADSTIPLSKLSFSPSTRPLSPGVDTVEIQDAKVTASKLASNAVETAKINNGAVTADKLAGDAVETVKIKDDAVTAPKIAAGAVGNTEIAADAVRGTEIQDGVVSEGKIGTDAVTTVKIKDANVTLSKLEDDVLVKALDNRQLFYDDFLGLQLDNLWRANGDAGGAASIVDSSTVSIICDNDIGDFYRLDWGAIQGVSMNAGKGLCVIQARTPDLGNLVVFVGIFNDANNFVGFRLDTAVDNNWYAVSKQGGVETATDTGLAQDALKTKFEVRYATVGGDITFYMDDVLKATIATNKFTATGHPCLKVQTLAAFSKELAVDSVLVSWDR